MHSISISKLQRVVVAANIVSLACVLLASPVVYADFPQNDLDQEDNLNALTGITQGEFDQVIEEVGFFYRPLVSFHGGDLVFDHLWTSSEVNAYAFRVADQWHVEMHGGMARRPEVTRDGFQLVICHEIGHHLGGYPFKRNDWAASEGESDWYATQACARWIWRAQTARNAEFRSTAPNEVIASCDDAWAEQADRDLCYRIAMAGKSLADVLAAMAGQSVSFGTPDSSVVSTTNPNHPAAQCRLDTYVAGALCTIFPDLDLIPGENAAGGRNSALAELQAAVYSCMPASPLVGAVGYNGKNRPRCWFKNQFSSPLP